MRSATQLSLHWILSHRQRPRPQLLREGEAPVAPEQLVADWIPMIRRKRMWMPRRRAEDLEAAEVADAVPAAMLLLPSPSIRL